MVTDEIARAWELPVQILPMSDDPVSTMVDIVDAGGRRTVSFQEYFVQLRHDVPVSGVTFHGHAAARPTFLELLDQAETVIVAPSNPIVSLGPIRSLPGVEEALRRNRRRIVAISPIVAGAALKGPADRMLRELGHDPSVVGVAAMYADIASTLVIDRADAALHGAVEAAGMACVVTETIMSDIDITTRLARTVVESARTGDQS